MPATAVNPLKRPRQDPVSCQFCRSKKLKCDRQHPCSNCTARGLSCDGLVVQAPRLAEPPEDPGELSVLARLKRLEEIVLGRDSTSSSHAQSTIASTDAQSKTTTSPPTPLLVCTPPSSDYHEAVQSLLETCTQNSRLGSTRGLEIRIMSAHQVSVDHEKLFHLQSASRHLSLPPKTEAIILFNHYFEAVDLLQHVVHFPTLQVTLHDVYAKLECGLPVLPSDVTVLLAIFASSAELCTYFPARARDFLSPSDAHKVSLFWMNSALEVLDYTRRTATSQLGDIQASIILGFLMFHIEGLSLRSRALAALAMTLARDLELHKVDAPDKLKFSTSKHQNVLEREIKRRVWWHVVATDW